MLQVWVQIPRTGFTTQRTWKVNRQVAASDINSDSCGHGQGFQV